nr:MAG TPA: hypothetical protein [Bacteriophage sp.]
MSSFILLNSNILSTPSRYLNYLFNCNKKRVTLQEVTNLHVTLPVWTKTYNSLYKLLRNYLVILNFVTVIFNEVTHLQLNYFR